MAATVVLSMMALSSGWTPVARGTTEAELQEWMQDQINGRLYDSCRTVKLQRQNVEVYQGFVEFINGQRTAVTVTVSDSGVTYRFNKSRPAGTQLDALQLDQLEAVVGQQRAEIVRLEELCRRAGLDPRAPAPNREQPRPEDTSARASVQESAATGSTGPVFTRELYEKVEKGMTCAQVSHLLGGPGATTSSSSFDGAAHEVRVWMNPDDAHICIVFRDGVVLVKTQAGLVNRAEPEQERTETDDFDNWQLAQPTDGRPVPPDLSLGQWLRDVYEARTKAAGEPAQVDVVQENNGVIVKLTYKDAEQAAHHMELCLTCPPPEGAGTGTDARTQRICIPARIRMDEKEETDSARMWEIMATLADQRPGQK